MTAWFTARKKKTRKVPVIVRKVSGNIYFRFGAELFDMVRMFWKNGTIEQLQMGVSTIATALARTAL